ncbi:peroxiredoxin family protein [Viridibacillus sp. NPDC096237]|uniref:peroxiredoxin family protein n=1 Tax=Viridibacillus sp. NPDC096237 TaxID=3390721 RepID=UPI003D066FE1
MNFRILVKTISVFMIIFMIIFTIKTNFVDKDESIGLEEYPSGLIEDQTNEVVKDSLDSNFGLKINDVAPDFKLKNLTGETVKLSDYRGKKILLNFWASWCPPCIQEMPYMQEYYKEYGDKSDMEILAVNMTRKEVGGIENIEKFIEEYELTFPIVLDDKGKVMDLYDVRSFPTTYIINKEGIITDIARSPLNDKKIEELINKSK